MKTNSKPISPFSGRTGGGALAASESPYLLLRRATLACLLWEDMFYENGTDNAKNITALIPQCRPEDVANLAVECRYVQKLRHVPLYIAVEMAKYKPMRPLLGTLLPRIIVRADELSEFLALYWKSGKKPLAKQIKVGLARAFMSFNEYQLAKYNRPDAIKLKDVMRLVHPVPADKDQSALWGRLLHDELATPDTWEVALSAGKDKKATWERLITQRKLGGLAFLRNLRNMEEQRVSPSVIREGFDVLNGKWLLPSNFFQAVKYAPTYMREIEDTMLRTLSTGPKLPGYTAFVVDVSGSMGQAVSEKSTLTRLDAAVSMAVLAAETCEHVVIYATAGSDGRQIHATEKLKPYRGFALVNEINAARQRLGGGGIFTRQCLEYIKAHEVGKVDRIIIFSDSQDCDSKNPIPAPFGEKNYIVDVSNHARGINYTGRWTAEISGWSEHFLTYIRAFEGVETPAQDDDEE